MGKVQNGPHPSLGKLDLGEDIGPLHYQPVEEGKGVERGVEEDPAPMSRVGCQGAHSIPHPFPKGEVWIGTVLQEHID